MVLQVWNQRTTKRTMTVMKQMSPQMTLWLQYATLMLSISVTMMPPHLAGRATTVSVERLQCFVQVCHNYIHLAVDFNC